MIKVTVEFIDTLLLVLSKLQCNCRALCLREYVELDKYKLNMTILLMGFLKYLGVSVLYFL